MFNQPITGKLLTALLFVMATSGATAAGQGDLQLPLDSETFATRGDAVLTQAELDAYLSRIPEEHRGGYLRDNERLGKALDDLMLIRLLANRGIDNGLLDDSLVQGSLRQTAMVFLAEEYRKDYLDERMLDDYSTPARELYLTEPELFERPQQLTFTHVLVRRGGESGELAAMEKIFSVYEELQEGASLEDLVSEYSEDPNAADNQGQYEDATAEELDRNVAVALQVMQPGQISEPVLSSNGWHILRLDEKTQAGKVEWEAAREEALRIARNRHQQSLIDALYREMLETEELVIEPGAVETLMQRYDVAADNRPSAESVSNRNQEATGDE